MSGWTTKVFKVAEGIFPTVSVKAQLWIGKSRYAGKTLGCSHHIHSVRISLSRRRNAPKSAFPQQGAASCSTFPLESLPFPDGWGCRFPELPFCWMQPQRQPPPERGSTARLTSLSQRRWKCPRSRHLPTGRSEIMVRWVIEKRYMCRTLELPWNENQPECRCHSAW